MFDDRVFLPHCLPGNLLDVLEVRNFKISVDGVLPLLAGIPLADLTFEYVELLV